MAKRKTRAETTGNVSVEFLRTGNPWIDAGIVGLYRVLNAKATYVDPPVEYHGAAKGTACLDVDITGDCPGPIDGHGASGQVRHV